MKREISTITLAATVLAVAACSTGTSTAPSASRSTSNSASASTSTTPSTTGDQPARIALPVAPGSTVEGLVAVDGHDIYARCTGTGSPTVVYFTGWAPDFSKRGVEAIGPIEAADAGKHRICSYERRNTGRSASVAGTQTPQDVVSDVDGVLGKLGEKGPFVLLGASFGGLVAGAYAVAHPDRTAGVLLLDASIPDDYLNEVRNHFQGMCLPANRQDDAWASQEKLDNCALAKWAYDRRAKEPDVPLTYLAAKDRDPSDVALDPLRKAFVTRWSPGVFTIVDAPHWMDEADPELVVRNLDTVIAAARSAP